MSKIWESLSTDGYIKVLATGQPFDVAIGGLEALLEAMRSGEIVEVPSLWGGRFVVRGSAITALDVYTAEARANVARQIAEQDEESDRKRRSMDAATEASVRVAESQAAIAKAVADNPEQWKQGGD